MGPKFYVAPVHFIFQQYGHELSRLTCKARDLLIFNRKRKFIKKYQICIEEMAASLRRIATPFGSSVRVK